MSDDESSPGGGPVWPIDKWISPTAVNHYLDCPYRVRLQYIDKVPQRPEPFNLHFAKGNAVHEILSRCAGMIQHGRQPPLSDFRAMARRRLPISEFPSDEARESHVRDIVSWSTYGLHYLDRDAEIISVERTTWREIPLIPELDRHRLMTRADLVLLRTEPDGERWVEFIDYKTGKQKDIPFVPAFTRFVLRQRLREVLPDPTTTRMQFTFLWLESFTPEQIDLSLDYCTEEWGKATTLLSHLVTEREWPARPSAWSCRYCPFDGYGCDAFTRLDTVVRPT